MPVKNAHTHPSGASRKGSPQILVSPQRINWMSIDETKTYTIIAIKQIEATEFHLQNHLIKEVQSETLFISKSIYSYQPDITITLGLSQMRFYRNKHFSHRPF